MPLRADLLADIRDRLETITSLNLTGSDDAWDIFEAYTFSIIIDAAQREGATVVFENLFGRPASDLVFRTSPGRIFGTEPPPPPIPYTHAVIQFPGKPGLELHQGIYISGKSGLLHECDVAVILRSEGVTCRRERVNPRCAKVILAAECKCYSSGLGIGLARGFLGLTSDLWNDGRFFISNTSSNSVKKLLTHHRRDWEHEVVPSNTVVVNRLRAMFERVFEEFNAGN
jgi:hypothetical protein